MLYLDDHLSCLLQLQFVNCITRYTSDIGPCLCCHITECMYVCMYVTQLDKSFAFLSFEATSAHFTPDRAIGLHIVKCAPGVQTGTDCYSDGTVGSMCPALLAQ